MPELPEVEVTRQGLVEHVPGNILNSWVYRRENLRWALPDLAPIAGEPLTAIGRRGKYLLFEFESGWILLHLGMSGSLRWHDGLQAVPSARTHDHVDLVFNGGILRFHDPRRFGSLLLWRRSDGPIAQHPRLLDLGLEPDDPAVDGEFLWQNLRQRHSPIKQVLMSGRPIVGAGNIYACEALFRAKIRPDRMAGSLTASDCDRLCFELQATLQEAIQLGGSTLKDFVRVNGQSGYFQQYNLVYGRQGLPCKVCSAEIHVTVQQQRSTFWCPNCQR